MNCRKRVFAMWGWTLGCGLLLGVCCRPAVAAENLEIRGIGKFSVDFSGDNRGSRTVFHCANPEQAGELASKRLADLCGWGAPKILPGDGTQIAIPGIGCWQLGLSGKDFVEIFAPSAAALAAGREKFKAETSGELAPVKPQSHKKFLDCFDNFAACLWTGGGGAKYRLPDNFEYLRKMQFANCSFYPQDCRLVAPGVLDSSIWDWMVKISEKYQVPFRQLSFNYPAGSFAFAYRDYPLPYIRPAGDHLGSPMSGYSTDDLIGGNSADPVLEKFEWDSRLRAGKILNASPWHVGWQGAVELSRIGLYITEQVAETPYYTAFFHKFLREKFHLTLAQVGERYFGDAQKFKSWEEVKIFPIKHFCGYDPQSALDLRQGNWELQPNPDAQAPEADKWQPGDPHDPMILTYRQHRKQRLFWNFWARRKFTIPAGRINDFRYCHIAGTQWGGLGQNVYPITVNGKIIANGRQIPGIHVFTYDFKDALKEGENEIVVNLIGQPFAGFVFLNGKEAKEYPYMGERLNRAFADMIEFAVAVRVKKVEDNIIAIRSIDPYKPIKLMVMSNFYDEGLRLAKQYGAYSHETGAGGAFWAPMMGHRYAATHGISDSSEPAGPARDALDLQKQIGYYLMYGNHCADMVFAVQHYNGVPEKKKWLDEHRELFRSMGKYVLPRQEIGILRSTKMIRLGFNECWHWDAGRGALQAVGRNFSYLELPDLHNRALAGEFPLIIDNSTTVMDEDDISAISDYARNGGTFIAMFNTARHSPVKADAWPLAAKFGLTVYEKSLKEERNLKDVPVNPLTFTKEQTLVPSLRGKTIEGAGVAIDANKDEGVTGGAIALSGQAEAIARWEDGKMAIAVVKLGKGKIIFMGTPFYLRSKDENGSWHNETARNALLDEMLVSLGVRRKSVSGDTSLWSEIWESKNGVYQVYLNGRMAKRGKNAAEIITATPKFRRADKVETLYELSANTPEMLPAVWRNGELTLPERTFTDKEVRIFGAAHPQIGMGALRWARIQAKIWHPLTPIAPERFPRELTKPDNIIPLAENWKHTLWTDGDFSRPGFDDSAWKTGKAGSFLVMGYPEKSKVAFRQTVTIPQNWAGKRIQLCFNANISGWGLVPWAQVWINGKLAPFKQPLVNVGHPGFVVDVSDMVKDGKLTLAVLVDGTFVQGKKNTVQTHPYGVLGMFYVESLPRPAETVALTDWKACTGYHTGIPVKPGQKASATFFETEFSLPARKGGQALKLVIPHGVRWIYINNHAFHTASIISHEIDIRNLVNWNGKNKLRLIYSLKPPIWNLVEKNLCPAAQLAFY